ncbi:MAG: sigma-70 family RNA polymerase sigma factor [Saprospiraceae bacterium]|nr:sigma-70 family RNA polymerase sigma factor [Saprospiraceae bacterium]
MNDSRAIPPRLLDGCRRGDAASQKEVYARYYGYGLHITLRYTKTREEAVEVLNDGFLKIFRHMDRYNPAFPFLSWFRRIMVNSAIDHFRFTRKENDMLELLEEGLSDQVFEMPSFKEGSDLLLIVQQLSPGYRMVFNLHVMEEYTHEEIGEMLGISASASRSNLTRAKQRLRELILDQWPSVMKL